jgi:hypothetical protein
VTFTQAFCDAYNDTLEHTPFGYLYEKIPVLESEVAFSQGLMRLKTALTGYRQLKPPKFKSFVREIDRASPTLYNYVKAHHPDLHFVLNPRDGKVPVTYLGKKGAQDVVEIAEKISGQVMREARKALPKILKALIGAGSDAAQVEIEAALSKAQTIIAKNPEVEWVYIAGWAGLLVGSMGYACMEEIGLNRVIQSGAQGVFGWWYGIAQTDLDTARKESIVLHRRLNEIHKTTCAQAQAMNAPIPPQLRQKMLDLIARISAVERTI